MWKILRKNVGGGRENMKNALSAYLGICVGKGTYPILLT